MNSEENFQIKKAAEKEAFSAGDLAKISLPGMPATERALHDLMKAEEWPFAEVRSAGRGGIKREYTPPAPLLSLIRKHLRGEEVTEQEVKAARARTSTADPARQAAPERSSNWRIKPGKPLASRRAESAQKADTPQDISPISALPVALALRLGRAMQSGEWAPPTLSLDKSEQIVRQALHSIAYVYTHEEQEVIVNSETALDAALRIAWEVLETPER